MMQQTGCFKHGLDPASPGREFTNSNVEEALELYYQSCSITVNTLAMARTVIHK